jgi:hypothetical protein
VHVTAIGGASNLRTAAVDENGQYRFEALEPGEYVVRACLGDVDRRQADLVLALFTSGALPPLRDVVLAAGQDRTLDVTLPLPALGTVRGTVSLNGAPAAGCRVTLAVADAASPLSAVADAMGGFVVTDVPPGDAQMRVLVRSAGQQELYRETVAVPAGTVTIADVALAAGSLGGRITASDGTPAVQINGDLLVLPGCTEVPADLAVHRREHRVHTVSVRAGAFRCDALTPGRALVVVRLRNRDASTTSVEVRAGSVAEVEIAAGRSKQ